jgi:hypothetical protein
MEVLYGLILLAVVAFFVVRLLLRRPALRGDSIAILAELELSQRPEARPT